MNRNEKSRIALRYWLLGAGYVKAVEAMTFAEEYHTGTRRDGVTPEFAHQVSIAHYVRTLAPHLRTPEDALAVAFLHDVREDYDVEYGVIEERFGPAVAKSVDAVTKEFKGERRDPAEVFAAIAADANASIVKLSDRINNHQSMVYVFSKQKVDAYTAETREYFLPMLKSARRRFADQEPAYENAKLVLESQLEFVGLLQARR